jgi:hypothetical protein
LKELFRPIEGIDVYYTFDFPFLSDPAFLRGTGSKKSPRLGENCAFRYEVENSASYRGTGILSFLIGNLLQEGSSERIMAVRGFCSSHPQITPNNADSNIRKIGVNQRNRRELVDS